MFSQVFKKLFCLVPIYCRVRIRMYLITAPILSVSQVQNTSFLMQAQHMEKTGYFCPLFLPACERPGGPALLDSDRSWIALIAHLHRGQRVGLMGLQFMQGQVLPRGQWLLNILNGFFNSQFKTVLMVGGSDNNLTTVSASVFILWTDSAQAVTPSAQRSLLQSFKLMIQITDFCQHM